MGSEFYLSQLTDRSREFFLNLSGFLESKRATDATAEVVLPHKWMEQHPSFQNESSMIQKSVSGAKVTNIDELMEAVYKARPAFERIIRKMVTDSG